MHSFLKRAGRYVITEKNSKRLLYYVNITKSTPILGSPFQGSWRGEAVTEGWFSLPPVIAFDDATSLVRGRQG